MAATSKRRINTRIAKKLNLPQAVVTKTVQLFFDEIISDLANGTRLEFREFGIFQPVVTKPRKGRNPRTGATVDVPMKAKVRFKAGRKMKETMKKGRME
jgi:integration host factor subunit beta